MFDIHYYESVDSTMDIARDNLVHGRVIQAGEQLGGRGRRGNVWHSPKGNLYQSMILKPKMPRDTWGQLSFVIAVALREAIGTQSIALKWPNDVLIDDKKLAGILIEVQGDFVVIGTGVNIAHCNDDRAKVSDCIEISVNDFRDVFLEKIIKYYDQWQMFGFAPIRKLWMSNAYKFGEGITANLKNKTVHGIFHNIDTDGFLILKSEYNGEEIKISSSEIINWEG